jgi:hypothetical protein
MSAWQRGIRATIVVVVATGVASVRMASAADDEIVQRLVRELEAMKQRVEKIEKVTKEQEAVIRRQDETIRRLTARSPAPGKAPALAGATTAPPPAVAASPPAGGTAPATTTVASEKPQEPWSPSQPISLVSGARGYLNISFDALVDFGWSTNPDVTVLERGDHDPLQRGFTVPNEEIFFDGAVDPYFKGVADIVFKLDEHNETEVELEEAYLTTTALPWNLQAKAGHFFSEFGRLNQQHPHAWDFVDQPLVIGRMFGPEGLRNPGARLSWLLPTPFYSELFAAVQNSNGGTAFSFRNDGETLFGRRPVDRSVRGAGDLLYVPRWVASFEPTDSQTIVAGLSGAFGPNASGNDTRTQIYGADVYWKWKPAWQSGGFPFVGWQTEVLGRRYEAGESLIPGRQSVVLPRETLFDWGAYSQIVYGFTQRWAAGLRGDWVSGDRGAFHADENRSDRFRLSPDLTFYPTEFSKLRLQYNYDHGQLHGDDSSVWMQVEFLLGSHAAHKF